MTLLQKHTHYNHSKDAIVKDDATKLIKKKVQRFFSAIKITHVKICINKIKIKKNIFDKKTPQKINKLTINHF